MRGRSTAWRWRSSVSSDDKPVAVIGIFSMVLSETLVDSQKSADRAPGFPARSDRRTGYEQCRRLLNEGAVRQARPLK
jgi:hypothetical protein